jgi:kexin
MVALVLSSRPDLSWRDVQSLVAHTSVMVNPEDPDWQINGAGHHFSHKFGFGKLDAYQMVESAKTWVPVGAQQVVPLSPKPVTEGDITTHHPIGATSSLVVVVEDHALGTLPFRLEHVTVTVSIQHECRGDLSVYLISPSGTTATLATPRPRDRSKEGLKDWTFMTVACWGESPVGTWRLLVRDQTNPNANGVLLHWNLTFFGEVGESFPSHPPRLVAGDIPSLTTAKIEPTKRDLSQETPTTTTAPTSLMTIFLGVGLLLTVGIAAIVVFRRMNKFKSGQAGVEHAIRTSEEGL